jgi:membrane-associated phospholipid phosphatase
MAVLMNTGIRVIVLLQGAGWLEAPMRFLTFLGYADFYFLVLPALYWCIDARLGIRMGLVLFASIMLNELGKLALNEPRPYWVSAQVKALAAEPTFGIPSGHAQNAVAIWGMLAARVRRRAVWVGAIVLVFLISVSRMYLGVHFPQDIVVGWLIGAAVLGAFLALWNPVGRSIAAQGWGRLSLVLLAICSVFLLAEALMVNALSTHATPADWVVNAARAGGPTVPDISMQPMVTYAGAFLGFTLGLRWMRRRGGFAPLGSIGRRIVCYVVGVAGVLFLYIGLKAVLPSGEDWLGSMLRFVRYGALGLWIAAGAPALFLRFGLMPAPAEDFNQSL